MNHAVLMCICTCAKIGFCLETSLKDQHRFKANNHSSIICWALVIRSEGSKKIPSSQVCTTIRLPHLRLWFFLFFFLVVVFPEFCLQNDAITYTCLCHCHFQFFPHLYQMLYAFVCSSTNRLLVCTENISSPPCLTASTMFSRFFLQLHRNYIHGFIIV